MRSERRRDLMRILQEGRASSQQEIVERLRALGHAVTQATVSRDLKQLGAVKVRSDGALVYRIPDQVPRSFSGDLLARGLRRTLDEFAVDVRPAGSLVVIVTAPGHAAAVARAIDLAPPEGVVGTVAGDDTIFVATPDPDSARELAARLAPGSGAGEASRGGGR